MHGRHCNEHSRGGRPAGDGHLQSRPLLRERLRRRHPRGSRTLHRDDRPSMNNSVLALIVVAAAGAACGGNSPTAPPSTPSSGSPENFTGSLPLRGSSFYSFTVATAEPVSVSLASLTAGGTGPATTSVVRLGLGVPLGTDCSINNSVDTAAGVTSPPTAPVHPHG